MDRPSASSCNKAYIPRHSLCCQLHIHDISLDHLIEQPSHCRTRVFGPVEQLKGALTGDSTAAEYEKSAETLGITPAAAKQAAFRMRKRYRQLFREEVTRTLSDEVEVDDEIGRLLESLRG